MTLTVKTKLQPLSSGTATSVQKVQYYMSDGSELPPAIPGFWDPKVSSSEVSYLAGFFVSYIEYLYSINTPFLLSPGDRVVRRLVNFDLDHKFTRKKPKPPIYHPPKFGHLKRPLYKPVSEDLYHVDAKDAKNIFKRQRRVDSINRLRFSKYKFLFGKYEAEIDRRKLVLRDYDLAFSKRFARYESRLASYERALADFKKKMPLRGFTLQKYHNLNPYVHAVLRGDSPGVSFMTQTWDAARPADPIAHPLWVVNLQSRSVPLVFFENPSSLSNSFGESVVESMMSSLRVKADTFDAVLIPRLFNKLANKKVDVGNLLAERHQTITLLTETLKSISNLISGKKKLLKSMSEVVRSPKAVSDEYLKFQFGISPLLNDYQSLVTALAETDDDMSVKVKGCIKKHITTFSDQNYTFTGILEVRIMLSYSCDNPLFRKLQEWGFVNPASIGWELTPWSFVVDWFYPVGDILSSSLSTVGLNFTGGTRAISFTGTIVSNGTVTPPLLPPPSGVVSLGSRGSWSGNLKIRDVIYTPPVYQLPSFKNPISWTHGFESLALLIQKLKS